MSIDKEIQDHISAVKNLVDVESFIARASDNICESINSRKNIFWCGNGGSAADSQHLAAEFLGRFTTDRAPLNSIALTTDTSTLTCISNDYSFEDIFARQIKAIGNKGDSIILISTSGNSKNLLKAIEISNSLSIKTISLLGKDGGLMKNISNLYYIVNSNVTARIQECHILIGHIICAEVEKKLGLV